MAKAAPYRVNATEGLPNNRPTQRPTQGV